jgi:hypothetical protein
MSPLFRNIMLLHDREQFPMPDVAQRLGVSIPAAGSRLQRARRELRSRIEKHCGRKGPAHCWKKPYTAELRTRVPASIPAVRGL